MSTAIDTTCRFCGGPPDDSCPGCGSLLCDGCSPHHRGSLDVPCTQDGVVLAQWSPCGPIPKEGNDARHERRPFH